MLWSDDDDIEGTFNIFYNTSRSIILKTWNFSDEDPKKSVYCNYIDK
jgi:hypothetical protein